MAPIMFHLGHKSTVLEGTSFIISDGSIIPLITWCRQIAGHQKMAIEPGTWPCHCRGPAVQLKTIASRVSPT